MIQNDNGSTKNEALYNKCVSIFQTTQNSSIKWLSYAVYLSFKTENGAFIQQYYEHH